MKTTIEIKKVEQGDLQDLMHISRQTFTETFADQNTANDMRLYLDQNLSEEKLRAELSGPGSEFYFALLEKKVAGYLKINLKGKHEMNEPVATEVERIYVLQEFQGWKIGQALFEKALEISQSHGAHYMWLGVWEKNERAIRFYVKNGMYVMGMHPFLLGHDLQRDLLMRKDLMQS